MRIEALIFDIGNVLVPFDWQPFKSQLLADSVNLTAEAEMEFRELMIRFDVGEMTGEIFARLATRLIGFKGGEAKFIAIWNGIFSSNPPMDRVILSLKERYPLFLLSNTSDLHLAYLMRNCDVLRHFTDGVYSFRAKCAKPERRIFEMAIKQFGLKAEKTAYVDDLAANVRSAADLGLKAIQYELTKHAEFEQRLAEIGVRLLVQIVGEPLFLFGVEFAAKLRALRFKFQGTTNHGLVPGHVTLLYRLIGRFKIVDVRVVTPQIFVRRLAAQRRATF
jgi:glucose-1-phosphatase